MFVVPKLYHAHKESGEKVGDFEGLALFASKRSLF